MNKEADWFNKELNGQCLGRREQMSLLGRDSNSEMKSGRFASETHRKSGTNYGGELSNHMTEHRLIKMG